MPTKLTDVSEPVNILYTGDGGTGKTTNMAAAANRGRMVFINAESGLKARALRQRRINIENIEVFPDPAQDEELSFKGLEALWLRMREELHTNPDAYPGGVSWDSITEIHKALLDDVVAAAVLRADRVGKERDPNFIALEDYGVMTEQTRFLMRRFRDLPCDFSCSALLRRDQDDDGSVAYNPAITPKLGIDLVGWMDMVCVCRVALVGGEEEFRGLFRPHGKFRGKDRLGAVPKWLVDPTFERIMKYVDEEDQYDLNNLLLDPVMVEARERNTAAGLTDPDARKSGGSADAESNPKTRKKVAA